MFLGLQRRAGSVREEQCVLEHTGETEIASVTWLAKRNCGNEAFCEYKDDGSLFGLEP